MRFRGQGVQKPAVNTQATLDYWALAIKSARLPVGTSVTSVCRAVGGPTLAASDWPNQKATPTIPMKANAIAKP